MIELKGKFKDAFEKWFVNHEMHNQSHFSNAQSNDYKEYLRWFYAMHPSLQYGVFEDFADYINIDLSVSIEYIEKKKRYYTEVATNYFFYSKTRDEAYRKGIKQLMKIYNTKHK